MNIVVICCDTFRADIVGPGQRLSHARTPHLDDLAAESVVFTRCFGEGFECGQENDGYRSGPLARLDLAAHTPEDDPDPADHPVITQSTASAPTSCGTGRGTTPMPTSATMGSRTTSTTAPCAGAT